MKNKRSIQILSVVVCILLVLLVLVQRTKMSRLFKSKTSSEITTSHSPKNNIDWIGIYTGTLPCADCEGIKVRLTLNKNYTYELSYLYLGRDSEPIVFSGTFTWNDEGSAISLPREGGFPTNYQVGEGQLFMLDIFGNRITGDLADMYILTKKTK